MLLPDWATLTYTVERDVHVGKGGSVKIAFNHPMPRSSGKARILARTGKSGKDSGAGHKKDRSMSALVQDGRPFDAPTDDGASLDFRGRQIFAALGSVDSESSDRRIGRRRMIR
jgi:hypothetical protein